MMVELGLGISFLCMAAFMWREVLKMRGAGKWPWAVEVPILLCVVMAAGGIIFLSVAFQALVP